MARKKIKTDAVVTCWYAETGTTGPVGEATDIASLRVKLPGLDWLHRINIDVDARTGTVKIGVETMADNDDANNPHLTVWPTGRFTVDS